jgi:predicted enzyme related to lactoylglutathione lyase
MSNGDYRGRFVWYELMAKDPKAAQAFYTKVIGWDTQPFEGGGMPYTMWTRNGQPLGGLMELPEDARKSGAPPSWLAYIGTPNVDETVAQARKLGAVVHVPPQDIPTVGRFSVLADPQGAAFAAFTPLPSSTSRPEGPPQVGDISWHELATTDHAAAFRFYSTLFGWEKDEAMDMGPMGIYQLYKRGTQQLGGIYNKPAEMPFPPNWLLYARVPDVHKGAETVKSLGGKVLNGPMEVPGGGWIVQIMDPQGAMFALHHTKAS